MAGQLTIDTLKASSGVLATQNGMTGIAKAWVNFNGSTAAIRGSFNVGSITKNGTGNYTVNFTTALSANYSTVITADSAAGTRQDCICNTWDNGTTTTIQFTTWSPSLGALKDPAVCNVSISGA